MRTFPLHTFWDSLGCVIQSHSLAPFTNESRTAEAQRGLGLYSEFCNSLIVRVLRANGKGNLALTLEDPRAANELFVTMPRRPTLGVSAFEALFPCRF